MAFAAPGEAQREARLVQGTFDSAADELSFQRTLAKALGGEVKISAGDAAGGDFFGISVALSGDTALVGAYRDDTGAGPDIGSAYVFARSGAAWSQQAKLTPADGAINDFFGISVALFGDTALVGAYGDDTTAGLDAGSAYVFTRSGTAWTQQAHLTAVEGAESDSFGISVALFGDTALVGAYTDATAAGPNAGSAFVFTRSGTAWTQQAQLTAGDAASADLFGYSVSLSTDTALVGARGDDSAAGADAGSAYVFTRSGPTWSQQAELKAGDAAAGDQFGISVALSGDTALVGAVHDDTPAGANVGSAYVFARSGTVWSQQAKLTAGDGAANDLFGFSVALSGDTALAGAAYDDSPAGDSGSAYVFARSGTMWTQQAKLTASDGAFSDAFGFSVAVSGGLALVGAAADSTGAAVLGSAYIYPIASLKLNDANRFGDASSPGVGGVAATLSVGAQSFGPVTTDAQGGFSFDPSVDLNLFYDLKFVGLGLNRVYQAVKPATLLPTSLVLPRDLRTRLDAKLLLLEATSLLVLPYNTAGARTLMSEWNMLLPELESVHVDRDHALGRLLTASEGLAGLYADTQPVAAEAAKITVDLVTSGLALRKLAAELSTAAAKQVGAQVAQGVTTLTVATLAQQLILKGLELAITFIQDSLIGAIQSVLPQFGQDLLGQGIDVTTKGVLAAFESGSWDNVDARTGVIGAVVEILAAEVGGRVIASGYVTQTQTELDLSVIRARALMGTGTVNEGFIASQEHAIAVSLRNADVLAFSQMIGATAKQWNLVGDLFILVARTAIPAKHIVATAGTIVKSLSVGGLLVAGVQDYSTIYDTAFDDVPVVAGRAFNPSMPAPASQITRQAKRSSATAAVVPSEYLNRLAAIKDRVTANDRAGATAQIQALLAAEDVLKVAVQNQLLRLLATSAGSELAAVDDTYRAAHAASGVFAGERVILYGVLTGYLIPSFAAPGDTDATVTTQIDQVTAAITAFEGAVTDAQNAAAGITAPALIVVPEHGLTSSAFGQTAPGVIELRARIVNAGQVPADGVTVSLSFVSPTTPVPAAALTSTALQTIGTLAPGESRLLTWTANATDTSPNGTGSNATYAVDVSATTARTSDAAGGFEVRAKLIDLVFAHEFEQ